MGVYLYCDYLFSGVLRFSGFWFRGLGFRGSRGLEFKLGLRALRFRGFRVSGFLLYRSLSSSHNASGRFVLMLLSSFCFSLWLLLSASRRGAGAGGGAAAAGVGEGHCLRCLEFHSLCPKPRSGYMWLSRVLQGFGGF